MGRLGVVRVERVGGMIGKWAAIFAMVAGATSVQADSQQPVSRTRASLLPDELFIVTLQCKQLMAEVGSAYEKTEPESVISTSATDYISVCSRVDGLQIMRCGTRFKDKNATFVSNGEKTIETLFVLVVEKPPLLLLQDEVGQNAMYINIQSRDAVLTSRQYFEMKTASGGKTIGANAKVCKAMLLSEADVKKLSKTK
jgi:hypothetical protein